MWTTVAMLGVLEAGGAFSLLDLLLTTARLQMLCRKVHDTIGVASRSGHDVFENMHVVSASVMLGRESVAQLSLSTVLPNVAVLPKDSRALQFATYSFAGALAETLLSFVSGWCVCVPSEQDLRESLAQAIVKLATNWSFTTSTILDTINVGSVPTLQTVLIGGEPIRTSHIDQWATHLHFRQTYESTETSGNVSSARLNANSTTRDVGKAATGRYWIVSPANYDKLAPIGATGVFLVEGPTIGRGYIVEHKSTAAAFVQPSSWRSQFREASDIMHFYKTGDLDQYQADGTRQLRGERIRKSSSAANELSLGRLNTRPGSHAVLRRKS
jgi:non-ribosomal peptide synthetase component F